MYPDFKELLSIFNANEVKYLIVGGYAVTFHAQPRATKDLDIWVQSDPGNARAVYRALQEFGAALAGLTPEDFLDREGFFRMGRAPVMVEILPSITGVDFEEAWQSRVEVAIDPETGLTAHLIGRDHLLAAKLAAGRPQDLADADAIRKAGSEG